MSRKQDWEGLRKVGYDWEKLKEVDFFFGNDWEEFEVHLM